MIALLISEIYIYLNSDNYLLYNVDGSYDAQTPVREFKLEKIKEVFTNTFLYFRIINFENIGQLLGAF